MSDSQKGLSLLEVLISILIINIAMIGFINLYSILCSELERAKNQIKSQRMAFQLLDVYPDSILVNLPSGWHYQVINQPYNQYCYKVKVIIQPNLDETITQERLYCY